MASQVWFGSKRVITVRSLEKSLKVRCGKNMHTCKTEGRSLTISRSPNPHQQIDLMWGLAFPILERIFGYVPAKRFRLGR